MNSPAIRHSAAGRNGLARARPCRAGQPNARSRFGARAQSAFAVACRDGKDGAVSAGNMTDPAALPVLNLRPGAPTCPGRPGQRGARNRPGLSRQSLAKVHGQAGKHSPAPLEGLRHD